MTLITLTGSLTIIVTTIQVCIMTHQRVLFFLFTCHAKNINQTTIYDQKQPHALTVQHTFVKKHILIINPVPIMTAADDSLEYFFNVFLKIRLDISCESSAGQRIHIKRQALYLQKIKVKT